MEGAINEDNTVNFYLKEEKKGEFPFWVKAEANGGEILWTENEVTFISACGATSAKIGEGAFEGDPEEYIIDGGIPYFSFE